MNIQQIKDNYTCLDYLGKPLKKTVSGWHIYRCPWRTDNHPSLTISPDGKIWRDLATGAEGGIIELIQTCLNTKDFKAVCSEFNSSSFSMLKSLDDKKEKDLKGNRFASFSVVPLQSRGLYAYLTNRGINTSIARQFLQEAHYSFQKRQDGRYLYALAYANDKGGYELRGAPYVGNPDGYKGGTAPKAITTHLGITNAPTVVFEGFFDMLSWVTMTGGVKHNMVVLNSVVNTEAGIEALRSIGGKVYLCLDNDKRGNEATTEILRVLPMAIDYRSHFSPSKDVNEHLCKRKG